jgi:hypothetical protein
MRGLVGLGALGDFSGGSGCVMGEKKRLEEHFKAIAPHEFLRVF